MSTTPTYHVLIATHKSSKELKTPLILKNLDTDESLSTNIDTVRESQKTYAKKYPEYKTEVFTLVPRR